MKQSLFQGEKTERGILKPLSQKKSWFFSIDETFSK